MRVKFLQKVDKIPAHSKTLALAWASRPPLPCTKSRRGTRRRWSRSRNERWRPDDEGRATGARVGPRRDAGLRISTPSARTPHALAPLIRDPFADVTRSYCLGWMPAFRTAMQFVISTTD